MRRLHGVLLPAAPAFGQSTQQAEKYGGPVLCDSRLLAPTNPTLCWPPNQPAWRQSDGPDGLSRTQNPMNSKDFVGRFVSALCANNVGLEQSFQLLN